MAKKKNKSKKQRLVSIETCLDGEIRTRHDKKGRPEEIRHVRHGKTVGFMLKLDPDKESGCWKPEKGQGQFMEHLSKGKGELYSSWHDGAEFEMVYQKWIDGHVAEMRLDAVNARQERAGRALKRGDFEKACELFEELLRYMARGDLWRPSVAVDFATCLEKVGRKEEALFFYEATAQSYRENNEPTKALKTEMKAEKLRAKGVKMWKAG